MTNKRIDVTVPVQFTEVIGYPIEMKIRRKLKLKPGGYANQPGAKPQARAQDYAPTMQPLQTGSGEGEES